MIVFENVNVSFQSDKQLLLIAYAAFSNLWEAWGFFFWK